MVVTKPERQIGPFTYEPQDDMPAEYRGALIQILSIQARIETEYPMYPERSP